MKQRSLFVFCLIVGSSVVAYSQAKTVTNADLEKFRQDRLKAEREYRENYAKLGFPSPEELDRRREQSRIETEQLSAKLRGERLERERIEVQQETATQIAAAYYRPAQTVIVQQQPYETGYFWSYGRRYRLPFIHQPFQQQGYFAGGQFWPTGPRTPPQPMWVPPRH
jgi:hypothetical protein